MAEPTKTTKKAEDLQAEQDKLKKELDDLRNSGGRPDDIKALKAKLAKAVADRQAAEATA